MFSQIRLIVISLLSLSCFACSGEPDIDEQIDNKLFLLNLPANRWIKYHEISPGDWWRRGHAGLAYDSTRGSLLVFGSETHGEDWDNVVHEFVIGKKRWRHHGKPADARSYRIDHEGYQVAGEGQIAPWAMHTYDGLEYDPVQDALIVVANPEHNPLKIENQAPTSFPIWRYALATHKWSPLHGGLGEKARLFGAATAYDAVGNRLFICKSGLWSLDSKNGAVEKIGKAPGCLHRTMAFDSWRRQIYVFGAYQPSNRIMRTSADHFLASSQEWETLVPSGDACPPYSKVPVAFDEGAGVFLLVVDSKYSDGKTNTGQSRTFIYDPATNGYQELADAQVPSLGMNFMMTWDKAHKVFFLITGGWKTGATVWALRLNRTLTQVGNG